ncbi:MAG: N-acetylmuramoyl-L-alanine amidase [Clostridiales bacterium]|nr:N-acetylmuramoyl-L-alanine amidase [Clostridiales bacterium]
MKFLIIAGHGGRDSGAVGNGFTEAELTREAAALLKNALDFYGEAEIADTSLNWFEYLKTNSHSFVGYDYVLELHFNSGGGSGTEIYVTPWESGVTVEEAVVKNICAAAGWKNRGVKVNNWNVISEVKRQGVSAALLEICFIDSPADMEIYENKKRELMEAAAAGIAEGFGLEGSVMEVFKDLNGHYAKQHINELKAMGVVNGDGSGNFNPDEKITRADAAIMVRNAIRYITGK